MSLRLLLMVLAVICFLLGTVGVNHPRLNLVALGLFFWSLSLVITAHGRG
jgi:hypothetical protein